MIATAPRETITVDTAKIACNGDRDSAHPRVFLTMGPDGFADCPYCGKRYVLKEGAAGAH
ncbi:MAG: zinc-finger domain-containing protein [Alphaproteobacteria bacterium]|nr:zinc-finger domain-containing protein [Alphaproteobacteria bacterium]